MIKLNPQNWNCSYSGVYLIKNIKTKKEYIGQFPIYKKRNKQWIFPLDWSEEMKQNFINKEVVPYVSE